MVKMNGICHCQQSYRTNSSRMIDFAVLMAAKTLACSASFADDVLVTSSSTTVPASITSVISLGSYPIEHEKNSITPSQNAFVEIEGHTIGDEHRSETSSKQFFNSIDKDRDGKLGQSELSQFLKDHVGGLTLDEDDETELEAASIMDRLDHDHDDELDSRDVFRYWKSLDSLLTVDEVAEWVVHSVQLPSEIGEIFRKNHVTGYDFPELVDKDGNALFEELQIEKATFRKKIVRLVNARMLGIGSKPTEPTDIKITLEGCHTAVLKWNKIESEGFPVHKFRVQRRRLNRDNDKRYDKMTSHKGCMSSCIKKNDVTTAQHNLDMHNNSDRVLSSNLKSTASDSKESCPSNDLSSENCEKILTPSQRNLLEWEDVYDQSLAGFHDFGLERGQKGYQYRIQAWNAVGKSEWVLFEIKQWGRKKCDRLVDTVQPIADLSSSSHLFVWLFSIWKFVYSCVNIVMGMLGLIVAVLKCKRAMQVSTASKIDPLFPSVMKLINTLMKAMLGIDIIPQSVSGIENNLQTAENHPYDVSVNSVGLFGYKESSKSRPSRPPSSSTPSKKVKNRSNSKVNKNQPVVSRLRLKGTRLGVDKDIPSESASERTLQKDQSSTTLCSYVMLHDDNTLLYRGDNIDFQHDNDMIEEKIDGADLVWNGSVRSMDSKYGTPECDDKHCNICKKRYKFGKRKRHFCSICFDTFCHKHGRTTHSNLVTCKVPGNCVCNLCLEKITSKS